MPAVSLSDRAVLLVSGTDAQHFLQNIVTTDIDALAEGEAVAGALLTPQGKILFDFLLSRADENAFRLDTRTDMVPDLLKRLMLYRLRAPVKFELQDQSVVGAFWDDELSAEDAPRHDTAAVPAGLLDTRFMSGHVVRRTYGFAKETGQGAEWDALRISNGVAESGRDFALGDAFPHDVLLDQNRGVGFRKGCFVGQEVVSRMQHRGTARRRILVARGESPLPPPGTELTAAGRPLGSLGTVVGRDAMALARIDRVADAQQSGIPILAGEAPVTLRIPPGMRFAFPAASAEQSATD